MNKMRNSDGLVNMVKASTTCSSTRSIQDEVTHQSRLKMNKQEQDILPRDDARFSRPKVVGACENACPVDTVTLSTLIAGLEEADERQKKVGREAPVPGRGVSVLDVDLQRQISQHPAADAVQAALEQINAVQAAPECTNDAVQTTITYPHTTKAEVQHAAAVKAASSVSTGGVQGPFSLNANRMREQGTPGVKELASATSVCKANHVVTSEVKKGLGAAIPPPVADETVVNYLCEVEHAAAVKTASSVSTGGVPESFSLNAHRMREEGTSGVKELASATSVCKHPAADAVQAVLEQTNAVQAAAECT
ncbi:hypothetical protein TrCOL_g7190, partial [Triparma columacea]